MTLPTRTVLELPRTGLGAALGQGFQKGTELGLQGLLKNFTAKKAAQTKEFTPLSTSEFKGLMGVGEIGKNFPGETQFQVKKKLDQRIAKVGRQRAQEEFGENPLDYLKEPEKVEELKDLAPDEIKKRETFKKMGLDPDKSAWGQVKDYLLGRTKTQKAFQSAVKKKPFERIFAPLRETLSFIEQSLGGGTYKIPEIRNGKVVIPKTASEAWKAHAEKGLTPEEADALQKYGFEGMVAIDLVGGLLKKAPAKALKKAEEIIKAKKYPENVLREIKDITKEYKGKVSAKKIPTEVTSPKYQEKLIEGRKVKAKELSKRPLKEYLKEKKPYEAPSVKAKKAQATSRLGTVDKLIKRTEEHLGKVEETLKEGVQSSKQRTIFRKSKANFEKQLEELRIEKKDLEYVAKRGRERFSYEKTLEEANAHNKKIKFAYDNPQTLDAAEIIRKFNRDQKYVQEAMDILKRRPDVPIAPYKDLYTNKLKTYNDSYREMIKKLNKEIEVTKGATKKNLEGLRDKFKTNLNINEGKLIKHAEKLETKQAIKEANVFLRKELADLRSDIPAFKKDLIKYKKAIETEIEAKVSKEAQKVLKQRYEKAFDEVFRKPTEQNIKKAVQKLEKAEQKAGIKKITVSEFQKLKGNAKAIFRTNHNKKAQVAKGIAVGVVKQLIKSKFGFNFPTRGIAMLPWLKKGGIGLSLTYPIFQLGKTIKKHVVVRNFKKVLATKNPRTISNYRKKLRGKGYTDTQINNLQKLAT